MSTRTNNQLSDNEIIRKIISSNDSSLFGILYDRYVKLVFNICLTILKNRDEAEDVSHDIFLKLYVSLNKFGEQSKFSTWLHRFTYNFCINHINRNVKKTVDLNDSYDAEDHSDEEVISLKYERLKAALDKVSSEDKAILLMKFQSEMTIEEIAEVLDLGQSATKMRIKRAKAKVVEAYKKVSQKVILLWTTLFTK